MRANPSPRLARSAARCGHVSIPGREGARLRARAGFRFGRGRRGGGSGGLGWSRGLDFSPGFRGGGGCAAGHGDLSASLHALLAALTSASDLSFFLSHRMSPFPETFETRFVRRAAKDTRAPPGCQRLLGVRQVSPPPRVRRASGPSRLRVAPRFAPRRAARVTNPCMLCCQPACPGET
jgi:hypothetical protein